MLLFMKVHAQMAERPKMLEGGIPDLQVPKMAIQDELFRNKDLETSKEIAKFGEAVHGVVGCKLLQGE